MSADLVHDRNDVMTPTPIRPCRHRCAIALAALAVLAAAPARGATYRFDALHSYVHFEVVHFGTSTIRGRFGPLQGSAELDRDAGTGRVQLRIPTAGVSTGAPVFDKRLREPDLLASEAHPEAYFVAERFIFDGPRVRELRGEFTLRGTSRPLTLTAQRFACYTSPVYRREVCGGDFSAEFERSDFGIDYGLPLIADRVRLLIQVEAIRD